ncbi:MAG: hypothetical protein LAT51_13045 [Flavobacteriaceae bacterium]|nr:hypothetical protein [Flavobacteriaceae bacterium]
MSKKIRSQYASDLIWLQKCLAGKNLIKDLSPLSESIERCYKPPNGNNSLWAHKMYKLNFGPIQSIQKIRPQNLKESNLLLTVECIGKCQEEPECDSINELKFDIRINAENSKQEKFITTWHLDCHIIEDGDGEPDHSHPLFHFQHGGKTILDLYENKDYTFGSSLFLESPRIAHPPMDIVLGVNFVLSQFYGDYWKEMLKTPKYLRLVEDSQKRLWKPYYSKLASYFDTPQFHEQASILIPDLFKR